MNAPLDLKLDKDAFLTWVQGREGRFELQESMVVMMTGASRNHWLLTKRFLRALDRRLDDDSWNVGASDLAVVTGGDVRYPDVLVEPTGGEGTDLASRNPKLIVEVLSPSTLTLDLTTKSAQYTALPSLEAYIVASQDEPHVWVWQRPSSDRKDRPFPRAPEEIVGFEGSISLTAFDIALPLSEIYRGIGRAGAGSGSKRAHRRPR